MNEIVLVIACVAMGISIAATFACYLIAKKLRDESMEYTDFWFHRLMDVEISIAKMYMDGKKDDEGI